MSLYSNFSEQEWQILQARAARVAAASAQQGDYRTDVMAALRVTVRGERYALPLDSITAVYDRTPIIPVPCTPPFVAGIANIRGHIIPVLDLAALLGIADGNTPGAAALVLAEHEDFTAAFCIEQIGEVAALPLGNLNALPPGIGLANTAYLRGTLPDGTTVLNIEAILGDPALNIDQNVG